jgi:hypothetical protein
MTTSVSSAVALRDPTDQKPVRQIAQPVSRRRHTLASRLAFLTICVAIVLTTLAYGTVHYWALAVFTISAAGLIAFWAVDAAVLRSALVAVNRLQWPILGLIILGWFSYCRCAIMTMEDFHSRRCVRFRSIRIRRV